MKAKDFKQSKKLKERIEQFVKENRIRKTKDGKLIFHKVVTKEDRNGAWFKGITYTKGKTVTVKEFNTRSDIPCAAGINVGTLRFAKHFIDDSDEDMIIRLHVHPRDIVCIPVHYFYDGKEVLYDKIRVKKAYVAS